MKKIMAIILALVFVSMMSVSALASPVGIGAHPQDVKGTYVQGGGASDVISVDVTWGNMAFTYTSAGAGTWDPETHSYTGSTSAAWTHAVKANEVVVVNHSNVAITAAFDFAPNATSATGTFSPASQTLASGVGREADAADSVTSALTMGGSISATHSKIGTVTVTVAKAG